MSLEREREAPRPPEFFEELLHNQVRQYGLDLAQHVVARLAGYLAELDTWRRRSNLTGRLTSEELVSHALESALGTSLIPQNTRVVDIGSGAGFPGLPLAIVRSDLDVTLVEPRAKRCAFLRHVVRTLELANVRVAETRIEDFVGDPFDLATTRAVGRFGPDSRYLKPEGLILAWTTRSSDAQPSEWTAVSERAIPGSRERIIRVLRGF